MNKTYLFIILILLTSSIHAQDITASDLLSRTNEVIKQEVTEIGELQDFQISFVEVVGMRSKDTLKTIKFTADYYYSEIGRLSFMSQNNADDKEKEFHYNKVSKTYRVTSYIVKDELDAMLEALELYNTVYQKPVPSHKVGMSFKVSDILELNYNCAPSRFPNTEKAYEWSGVIMFKDKEYTIDISVDRGELVVLNTLLKSSLSYFNDEMESEAEEIYDINSFEIEGLEN
ncbi:hypothetical protein OAT16_10980 [Prolixibacteraceae bacterium]|nr:hypothetical protein [Prolixibacteraceae bacterium]